MLAVRAFLRDRSHDTWLRVLPVLWALGPPLMVVSRSVFRPYAAARYVFPSLVRLDPLVADRPPDTTSCDTVEPPVDARPPTTN